MDKTYQLDLISKLGNEDLKEYVDQFKQGFLCGTSPFQIGDQLIEALYTFLSFCGMNTVLVSGHIWQNNGLQRHSWLERMDGSIIDPLADQFMNPLGENMAAVFVGERPAWYYPS